MLLRLISSALLMAGVLLLSPIGTAAVDERTNTLVVSDLAGVLRSVERLVQAFDQADGEVLIEARILKVDLTDDMSLGVDWRQLFSGADLAARSNLRVLGEIINGAATGQAPGLKTTTSAPAPAARNTPHRRCR